MQSNIEWEEVCKTFCERFGFELVFVNASSFGYQTKDGQLVHMYPEEMQEFLTRENHKC